MAAPVWVNGQVLNASDVNNWFVSLAAYKTATTNRNTLTATIDPDLQLAITAANSFWEVRAGVIYVASAGAFKWTWTAPAGVTGGYTVALAQGTPMPLGLNWAATQTAATDGTVYGIQLQGMLGIGSTTGTFGINWASNSGPNSLTVGIGSYLMATRIG